MNDFSHRFSSSYQRVLCHFVKWFGVACALFGLLVFVTASFSLLVHGETADGRVWAAALAPLVVALGLGLRWAGDRSLRWMSHGKTVSEALLGSSTSSITEAQWTNRTRLARIIKWSGAGQAFFWTLALMALVGDSLLEKWRPGFSEWAIAVAVVGILTGIAIQWVGKAKIRAAQQKREFRYLVREDYRTRD